MALISLENLIDLLKTDSMIQAKKNIYAQIQTCIKNQPVTHSLEQMLVTMIKKNLEENNLPNEALVTWILCTEQSKNLTQEFIKAIYQHSRNLDQLVPLLSKLMIEDLLDIEKILSNSDSAMNNSILDAIGKVSNIVHFKVYLDFINDKLVKIIFSLKCDETRNILIDFVLLKIDLFSVSSYSAIEQKEVICVFKNSYVQEIDQLRVDNNKNWYKLCMFTMKYCGKLLHSDIELTNAILRNVEIGFKTKTVQDRLMSYDCWKVLIDTCNLDDAYICNSKQMRLLIKPLKVKLSKNEEVIQKRFHIWFYLIEILQEKCLLCLEDFIKFCFELPSNNNMSDMCVESNIVKDTWINRIEVLVNILGHFGHKEDSCLKVRTFHFEKAIVTSINFLEFDLLIIYSIHVACKMLLKWDNSSDRKIKVKCLWGSLFKILQNLNENAKEGVLHKISKILNCFLQDTINNPDHFDEIIVPVFYLLSSFEEPICNSLLLNEILVFPVVRFMLSQQTIKTQWCKEVVKLVKSVPKTGNKLFYFNRICELLKTSSYNKNNNFVVHFWLQLAEELYVICKTPREGFNDFKDDAMFFLTWIFSCNVFEEMQNEVMSMWKKIFAEIFTISNTFGEDLLQNCEKLINKFPEIVNNILMFLPDISQILMEGKTSKRYVLALANVTFKCLQNPCTPKDRIIMSVAVLKKVLCVCLSGDSTESTVLRIYECIEYLLKPHEVFEILEIFKDVVPKLTNNVKKKIPQSLKQILNDLTTNPDVLVSQDALFVLNQLELEENKKEPQQLFVRPSVSTRSAKIASMAKDNAYSPSVKGSILKVLARDAPKEKFEAAPSNNRVSSPSSRVKKIIKNTVLLPGNKMKNIDEDSGEFVPINKEVKIDKSKLSEHQKEVMKRRREDIPALYQDLSQSQPNSTDASNSSDLQNKSDWSVNDNFKDILSDLKKKTDILQENLDADLMDIDEGILSGRNESDRDGNGTTGSGNTLPKYDLNVNFKRALGNEEFTCRSEAKRSEHTNVNQDKVENNNEIIKNTDDVTKPVFCSSKFEEKGVKTEAAQAPIFPEHDLHRSDISPDKTPKKKHKNHAIDTGVETCNRTHFDRFESKLIIGRRMSDSHVLLLRESDHELLDDSFDHDELTDDPLAGFKNVRAKLKESKIRIREKRKKHLEGGKHRRKSSDGASIDDFEVDSLMRKRYKSLDSLNDTSKKGKKYFKIIQNDIEVSNSIKLRISITQEEDVQHPERDILEQLDTEISNIDAHLQSNSQLMSSNKKTTDNSENIFESLDITNVMDSKVSGSEALGADVIENPVEYLAMCDSSEVGDEKLDKPAITSGDSVNRDDKQAVEDANSLAIDETSLGCDDSKPVHIDDDYGENSKSASTIDSDDKESVENVSKSLVGNENVKQINIKKRRQRELERIKMDIVGAEEFMVSTPRKRKTSKLLDSSSFASEITINNKTPNQPPSSKKIGKKKDDDLIVSDSSLHLEVEKDIEDLNGDDSKKITLKISKDDPNALVKKSDVKAKIKRKNNTKVSEIVDDAKKENNEQQDCTYPEFKLKGKRKKNIRERDNDLENTPSVKTNVSDENENKPSKDNKSSEFTVDLTNLERRKSKNARIIKSKSSENEKSTDSATGNGREISKRIRDRKRKLHEQGSDLTPLKVLRSKSNQSEIGNENKDVNKNSVKASRKRRSKLEDPNCTQVEVLKDSEDIVESSEDIVEPIVRQGNFFFKNTAKSDDKDAETKEEGNYKEHDEVTLQDQEDKKDSPNYPKQIIVDDTTDNSSSSDNYICEINGVKLTKFNSEDITMTEACESHTSIPKEELICDAEEEKDSSAEVATENEFDDKLQENTSENSDIKAEISDNDTETCDDDIFRRVKIKIPIMQENQSKDITDEIEAEITDTPDVKNEKIPIKDDETETCDPYINIEKEQDVVEKLENPGPGAYRTVINDLNFDSLPIVFDTPKKNIPSSPICDDTPDRNNELLKCTLDISPIKTESVAPETSEKERKPLVVKRFHIKKTNSRSAKLLNLIPYPDETTSSRMTKIHVRKTPTQIEITSPSTQRVQKMILNCGKLQQQGEKLNDGIMSSESISNESFGEGIGLITQDNVLKFTRELPSPLATPNSSILKKRKLSEITDESFLPHAKRRKRVNFSDPPTTSKKIYFTEKEEKYEHDSAAETSVSLISGLNLMKANSIYPKLTACTLDISEVIVSLNQELLNHFHSINIKTVGDLAELNESQINRLEFLPEPRLSRITDVLDSIYSSYKEKLLTENVRFPIYSDLIDCTDSIQNISKFIGSVKTAKDLRLKNIVTIADLAKLTKPEVAQLSLKLPHILNALQKYQRKLQKGRILARQMEEEMKEKDEDIDLDETNVSEDTGEEEKNKIMDRGDTEKISKELLENSEGGEQSSKERTVGEEIEYIKQNFNIDELRVIFSKIKEILSAHQYEKSENQD